MFLILRIIYSLCKTIMLILRIIYSLCKTMLFIPMGRIQRTFCSLQSEIFFSQKLSKVDVGNLWKSQVMSYRRYRRGIQNIKQEKTSLLVQYDERILLVGASTTQYYIHYEHYYRNGWDSNPSPRPPLGLIQCANISTCILEQILMLYCPSVYCAVYLKPELSTYTEHLVPYFLIIM